ncbi:MAG: hypothetical protein ABIH18_09445 [Candidatus Omnitrophota bacterium]
MMKSKLFSKNLAKRVLFLKTILIVIFIFCGCSLNEARPKYILENTPEAIQEIVKTEYHFDINASLFEDTLWIYIPVEDILIPPEKPKKYTEKFIFGDKETTAKLKNYRLLINYLAKPNPDPQEKQQEFEFNKKVIEKISNTWMVIRRVLFSIDRENSKEPDFICMVITDIKNGIEVRELSYYPDLKKVSYGYISPGEYQHRIVQEYEPIMEAIGDNEGLYLKYYTLTLKEFIPKQIRHRIELKFKTPEVGETVDIDEEVKKTTTLTLKIYNFNDFDEAEMYNLVTGKKSLYNKTVFETNPAN